MLCGSRANGLGGEYTSVKARKKLSPGPNVHYCISLLLN